MKKNKLKTLIKEAFIAEKKNTLLNENAPGFNNRKQGEALPTLESVKAAYEAKKLKEDTSKAKELSDRVLNIAAEGIRDLNGTELMEFRALIAQAFDMKDEAKKLKETAETVEEDRMGNVDLFVESSLEDLEQVVRNLAHTADMSEEEAAEMAIKHIEDTFERADLDESKMEKELKTIYKAETEREERFAIAKELFPKLAAKQEGGEFVNLIPLSKAQKDQVYANRYLQVITKAALQEADTEETLPGKGREYAEKPVDENLDKVSLANATATRANAAIINAPTMGAVLLKVYKQLQDKEQTDFSTNPELKIILAKLEKLSSQVQGASKPSSDAKLKESIITKADMIVESFKTKA